MKRIQSNPSSRRKFILKSAASLASFMIIPRFVLGGKKADGSFYIPPSDLISLGFIGIGKQGRGLTNSFLSTGEVKITALSEIYQAKVTLTLDRIKAYYEKNPSQGAYSDLPLYTDYRELLARTDIDAVVIATPDHWHASMSVHAAKAGKDIYCEKPLALSVKEGRAMVNAARKYKRVLQTGSMQRSWPEFRQCAELIRNGYLGEIKSIKVNVGPPPIPYDLTAEAIPDGLDWAKWLGPNKSVSFNKELAPPITQDVFPNWRKYREFGGGGMTDWGAHMFDIVQWSLDMDASGPIEISPADGKDHKFLTYRYANGIIMTHEPWEWSNAIEFTGTEGTLRIQRRKLETSNPALKDKIISPSEKHVYFSENHYKDFLNSVRKRTKPICDVEIGHRTASVCNLGNIAYQLNKPLKWDPIKERIANDIEASALLGRSLKNEWGMKM